MATPPDELDEFRELREIDRRVRERERARRELESRDPTAPRTIDQQEEQQEEQRQVRDEPLVRAQTRTGRFGTPPAEGETGVREAISETGRAAREEIESRPGGDVATVALAAGAPVAAAEPTPFGEVGVGAAAGAALVGGAAVAAADERFQRDELGIGRIFPRQEVPAQRGRETEVPVGPTMPTDEVGVERPFGFEEIGLGERIVRDEVPLSPTQERREAQPQRDTVVPRDFPLAGRDFPADPTRERIARQPDVTGFETAPVGVGVGEQIGRERRGAEQFRRRRGAEPELIEEIISGGGMIGRPERDFVERQFPTGAGAVVGREATRAEQATEPTIQETEATSPGLTPGVSAPTRLLPPLLERDTDVTQTPDVVIDSPPMTDTVPTTRIDTIPGLAAPPATETPPGLGEPTATELPPDFPTEAPPEFPAEEPPGVREGPPRRPFDIDDEDIDSNDEDRFRGPLFFFEREFESPVATPEEVLGGDT